MSLPRINEHQKFTLEIPSSKKKVKYRPFLTKEEKVLMIAMESKDERQIMESIIDTIDACVDGGVDKKTLTPYDVEYMFIKLRTKSVGESSNVGILCSNKECKHVNEIALDLESATIEYPSEKVSNIIDLEDDMTLELRHPSYMELVDDVSNENSINAAFNIFKNCLFVLHTPNNRHVFAEESDEDVNNFIESLTAKQLDKIQKFMKNAPKVQLNVEFDCEKCGHKNKYDLEGLENFF